MPRNIIYFDLFSFLPRNVWQAIGIISDGQKSLKSISRSLALLVGHANDRSRHL